jgi:hypothetical protein
VTMATLPFKLTMFAPLWLIISVWNILSVRWTSQRVGDLTPDNDEGEPGHN